MKTVTSWTWFCQRGSKILNCLAREGDILINCSISSPGLLKASPPLHCLRHLHNIVPMYLKIQARKGSEQGTGYHTHTNTQKAPGWFSLGGRKTSLWADLWASGLQRKGDFLEASTKSDPKIQALKPHNTVFVQYKKYRRCAAPKSHTRPENVNIWGFGQNISVPRCSLNVQTSIEKKNKQLIPNELNF